MIITRARLDDLDAIMTLEADGFDQGSWSRDSWSDELTVDDRQVLAYRDADDRLIAVATLLVVAITAAVQRRVDQIN